MQLGFTLILWIIVVVIVFIIARAFDIRAFSAFVLGLIVGLIVLALGFPITDISMDLFRDQLMVLYALIIGLTWLIIVIYILWKIFTDRPQSDRVVLVEGGKVTHDVQGSTIFNNNGSQTTTVTTKSVEPVVTRTVEPTMTKF